MLKLSVWAAAGPTVEVTTDGCLLGCSGRDGRLGAVEGEPWVLEKVFAEEAVEGPKG